MTTTIIKGREVTRPSTTPLKSSILDHATLGPDLANFGGSNNAGLWPSYNCMDTLNAALLCPPDDQDMKTFGFGGWTPAFEFVYYGGVQCSNVGLDRADMLSEIRRVYLANEGRGIEQALLETRFVAQSASGDDNDPYLNAAWSAPVDVSVTGLTGSLSIAAALAALEGYAAAHYAGVPTIHMPRAAASILNERIVWEGDKAYTRLGSKIAMGGGYDDSTDFAAGDVTMFATGEVYIEKSEEVEVNAYVMPGDGLNAETDSGNDFTDNTSLGLVERMYRVAVDCFVAKANATLGA